jgi:hypothetical protein
MTVKSFIVQATGEKKDNFFTFGLFMGAVGNCKELLGTSKSCWELLGTVGNCSYLSDDFSNFSAINLSSTPFTFFAKYIQKKIEKLYVIRGSDFITKDLLTHLYQAYY